MAEDPFEDVKAILDRTDEHIVEFGARIRHFLDKEAWGLRVDRDPVTGEYIHKVIVFGQPGGKVKAVARDVWGGLRSTLDHLNSACMRIGGVASRSPANRFPFSGSREEFDRVIGTRSPQVARAATDYWASLGPFRGGDERLYALASVRNTEEHWKLRAAVFLVFDVQVTFTNVRPWIQKMIEPPAGTGSGTAYEMELFRSVELTSDYHVEAALSIRFQDFNAFEGQDVQGAFDETTRKVRQIVNETEAIYRRAGLI